MIKFPLVSMLERDCKFIDIHLSSRPSSKHFFSAAKDPDNPHDITSIDLKGDALRRLLHGAGNDHDNGHLAPTQVLNDGKGRCPCDSSGAV